MQNHNEYVYFFALGIAAYEFLFRRYVSASKRTLFTQGMLLAASVLLCTMKYFSFSTVIAIAVFALVYCVTVKCVTAAIKNERFLLEQFLIKNLVIIIFLLALRLLVVSPESNQWFERLWNAVIGNLDISSSIVMYCIGYLFVIDGGTSIVKGVFKKFPLLVQQALKAIGTSHEIPQSEKENTGELIGIIERLLILTFVLAGNYEAVGFSVAAKSVARFKELDDKNFAEYYLLGTSVSVGIAVAVGMAIKNCC